MDMFVIEYNYGGTFVRGRRIQYVGGQQHIFENCDADRMSNMEVHDMLREIGVTHWKTLHYCEPCFELTNGLKSLNSDADVLHMVSSLDSKKYIKVYVEVEDNISNVQPLQSSGDGRLHLEWAEHSESASLNDDIYSLKDLQVDTEEEMTEKGEEYTSTSTDVHLRMKFGSLKEIKELVKENAMKNGHNVRFVKNEVSRLTALCEVGCKWKLNASKMHEEDTFQIKTFNEVHTCARSLINRHASAKWVAQQYAERFKSQPDWPISSIIETVRREYIINISAILAYRARRIAREMNDGCDMDQYKQLWSYAEEIRRTNPDSTFKVKVDRQTPSSDITFCRAYMCFDACKRGILSGGRPLLCLDGCHLKGQCPGHLFTAVGIDANDGIYPVAVAVVESECTDSWEWFLKLVVADLGLNNGYGWTFISDQQKVVHISI